MAFVRGHFGSPGDGYSISKILGDASARQYFRLVEESGKSWILAAYPEPFDPQSFTYKQVYDVLRQIGLPVPEIFQLDGSLGIVVQQDLGNETLQKRLVHCPADEKERLLQQAIAHIVAIQSRGTDALQPHYEASQLAFDEPKLRWELQFFERHYLGSYRKLQGQDRQQMGQEFDRLAAALAERPRRLCHRDYHVRNLMCRQGRLYIIDFQDARRGPLSYDLASLLKDSIDLSAAQTQALIDAYRSLAPQKLAAQEFAREFHRMCVQRLLKALGTYAYQITLRQNFIYEQYIPGSLRRVLCSLEELDEFPVIRSLVERELE